MNRHKSAKRYLPYLWPLVALLGLVIVGIGLLWRSNLYETRDTAGFGAFGENTAEDAVKPNNEAQEGLAVWVDTSPSMAGFIKEDNKDRVPFVYRQLLRKMDTVAKGYSPAATLTYYRYNSLYTLPETADDSARATARTEHTLSEKQNWELTNQASYKAAAAGVQKGGESTALPSVLNSLELDKPALILTDFEADGLRLPSQEYQKPLERIFKYGLCVSVVAMKAAYSGVLYNYLNDGDDYAYGTETKDTVPMMSSYTGQYRARSFYAVIVGTGEQCAAIRDHVIAVYSDLCQKGVTDPFKSLTNAPDMTAKDFVAFETANYRLNDRFDSLTAVDGKKASAVTWTEMTPVVKTAKAPSADMTEASKTAAEDDGIPKYLIIKEPKTTGQKAVLTLHITPQSEAYADTYTSDKFTVEKKEIASVVQTKMEAPDEQAGPAATVNESPSTLLARGGKYVLLTKVIKNAADKEYGWFTCTPIKPDANGLTFSLNVNASDAVAGLYRVELLVNCKHSIKVNGQGDEKWIVEWSVDQQELAMRIKGKERVAVKTANLRAQLEQFRRENVEQSGQKNLQIADLTVYLEIR